MKFNQTNNVGSSLCQSKMIASKLGTSVFSIPFEFDNILGNGNIGICDSLFSSQIISIVE